MKTKILLVGGYGYLGSHLLEYLITDLNKEITVCDIGIFFSNYNRGNEELINKNFVDFTEDELEEYNLILICSDIDVPEFYDCGIYDNYVDKYLRVLKSCTNLMNTKIVHFNNCYKNVDTESKYYDYLIKIEQSIANDAINKNYHIIECPELYGGKYRIRNDLFINDVILKFIVDKCYYLSGDILKDINFMHINKYVKRVVKIIDNILSNDELDSGYDLINSNKLSKFYICNILQWLLGSEYQLYVYPGDNVQLDFNTYINFDESEEITYTLQLYKKIFSEISNIDIHNFQFNNRYIINNSIVGNNFYSLLSDNGANIFK